MGDSLLDWRVTSRSRPGIEHQCDLGAFGGFGYCGCEYFQFRIAPLLRDHAAGNRPARCCHLIAARNAALDATVAALLRQRDAVAEEWHNS